MRASARTRSLGDQGLAIVKVASDTNKSMKPVRPVSTRKAEREAREAERKQQAANRKAELRRVIEIASIRPTPGSSDLLGRVLGATTTAAVDNAGRVRAVDVYDLVGMAPIHLKKESGK